MSTHSGSPLRAFARLDEETQNRRADRDLDGRCFRCHELGIHLICSRWKVFGEEDLTQLPIFDKIMETDILTIVQRRTGDKNYPLLGICSGCSFVDLWCTKLGLSGIAFKQRLFTRFGVADQTDLTDLSTNSQEFTRVMMQDLPVCVSPVARRPKQRPDYRRIRGWIENCSSSHDACRPDRSESLKTVRVIDVIRRSVVRLPARSPYLALSYVWGSVNQPSFPLATETLPFRLTLRLPKTIEHAMRATRKLGFAYLWVDSVCIDQSSPGDKASQINIMDHIYRGAHAILIALGSRSANSGLCRVGRWEKQERQILVYHQGQPRYLSFLPTLREELDRSIWTKRGWTYQEGVLSHRCIFFGRNQVYFTCNETSTSEDNVDTPFWNVTSTMRFKLDTRLRYIFFQHPVHDNPFKIPKQQQCQPSMIFNSMIREYTNRKLTNDNDTLDAVAGVLRLLKGSIFPQGFLFGLPLDIFRSALLWTHGSAAPLRRRSNANFPSWSWAAWHPDNPISIDADTEVECRHSQPPLEIWHLGRRIDFGFNDSYAEPLACKRGVDILVRLYALYKSSVRSFSVEEGSTMPRSHPGALYLSGIILCLPCSLVIAPPTSTANHAERTLQFGHVVHGGPAREQDFSVSEEALFQTGKNPQKLDCLLMSVIHLCTDGGGAHLVSLRVMILGWTAGVARRIGIAKILFTEDELIGLWSESDALYRGFWLG